MTFKHNNMKKIALLAIFSLIILQTKAQVKFHLGASTAMNSTFVLDKGLKADPRYLTTATYKWAPIGVSFGMDIGNKFGLQLESIKAAQGQVYEVIDAAKEVVGTRTFDMSYIQLPLMMKMMSGGSGLTRMNFQLGPQLSILQSGTEILEYAKSIQNLPEGELPPVDAIPLPDGTYDMPAVDSIVSSTNPTDIANAAFEFKNKEIQIAAAFGLDIDISRNMYLSTLVRANYSFTDMRGEGLLNLLASGSYTDITKQRANLAVGVQLALHRMIGGTRSSNAKDKKLRDAMKSE